MPTGPESSAEFLPLRWLGYGIDLTRVNPFNYKSVLSAETQVPIINLAKDTSTQTVTIGGVEYVIPKIVFASEDVTGGGFNQTFQDGTIAVNSLQDDSSLAYRLLSVTTSDNSLFALNKALPTKNQFYFFSNDYGAYNAGLRNYLDFINEEGLLTHVSKLVAFDSEDPEVVQSYVEFFRTVGSHFITSTGYGARFQLQVWASNKDEDVNNNFVRDVTASVNGLNDGGEYDKTVFRESQYWKFNRLSQRIVTVRGGSASLADSLVDSPTYSAFQQWQASTSGSPELVTIRTSELWTLLREANDAKLRAIANDLQKAFTYLSSLRKDAANDKTAWVTFQMDSNSAEFGILSPSAVIKGGDSDELYLPQSLSLGPPKLQWGSSSSSVQQLIVVVEIISDGTPIEIYISSGSGTAQEAYETKGGIQWYSNVPVSS